MNFWPTKYLGLVTLLFETAPKGWAEMLASVPGALFLLRLHPKIHN